MEPPERCKKTPTVASKQNIRFRGIGGTIEGINEREKRNCLQRPTGASGAQTHLAFLSSRNFHLRNELEPERQPRTRDTAMAKRTWDTKNFPAPLSQ